MATTFVTIDNSGRDHQVGQRHVSLAATDSCGSPSASWGDGRSADPGDGAASGRHAKASANDDESTEVISSGDAAKGGCRRGGHRDRAGSGRGRTRSGLAL